MVVVSFVMSGIVCWMYYEVLKELGLSRTVSSFADYRVFTIASVIVLASPVLMLRRRPGWIGYLIGSLISFGVAAYFVSRVVDQVVHELAYWTSGPSIVYLSIGVLFALVRHVGGAGLIALVTTEVADGVQSDPTKVAASIWV